MKNFFLNPRKLHTSGTGPGAPLTPATPAQSMKNFHFNRRKLLTGAGMVAGAGVIAMGWDKLSVAQTYDPLLRAGNVMDRRLQRLIMAGRPLAPEYPIELLTPNFPQDGGFGAPGIDPDPTYDAALAAGFPDWRLQVDGLVDRPGSFTLDEVRSMPSRTQITMHCCDEGWSAIAQWTGVPLGWLLDYVGIQEKARYVVFYCMDKIRGDNIFSSIDTVDAYHPQTILAHGMNGKDLPKTNGAPLRLRTELQVGYKNSKHINHISVVDSLEGIGRGHGGFWEDRGFQWYAGW